VVWFNIVGVIYLTAVIDRIHFRSGEFPLEVSATDGGHPSLSTVGMLRVMVRDVDNETISSLGVGRALRSALASDRLATVLSVLLAGVVLTIAVILLCAVVMERRRCRLPDKLAGCRCCFPLRHSHRKTDGSVADVLTTSCCCCCCMDEETQRQRKCKHKLPTDDATARTEDISRSTSTVVTTAVRRVSAFSESCECLAIIEMPRVLEYYTRVVIYYSSTRNFPFPITIFTFGRRLQ